MFITSAPNLLVNVGEAPAERSIRAAVKDAVRAFIAVVHTEDACCARRCDGGIMGSGERVFHGSTCGPIHSRAGHLSALSGMMSDINIRAVHLGTIGRISSIVSAHTNFPGAVCSIVSGIADRNICLDVLRQTL